MGTLFFRLRLETGQPVCVVFRATRRSSSLHPVQREYLKTKLNAGLALWQMVDLSKTLSSLRPAHRFLRPRVSNRKSNPNLELLSHKSQALYRLRLAQVNNSFRANVFPTGEANFGKSMYRPPQQETREGFDLYTTSSPGIFPRDEVGFVQYPGLICLNSIVKQGPAYKNEGPDPNEGSNQQ